MTLFLAGKTKDSTLAFASDGMYVNPEKTKVKGTRAPKIFPLNQVPDVVLAMTGIAGFMSVNAWYLDRMLGEIYRDVLLYPSRYAREVTSEIVHHIYTHVDKQLLREIEKLADYLKNETPDDDFNTRMNIFSLRRTGPIASRLLFTAEKPYIRNLGFDSTFEFPFYTGGRNNFANETLLELMLRDDNLYSATEIKDLFFYILSRTEDKEKFVGGNYFLGELTASRSYLEAYGPKEDRFMPVEIGTYRLDPKRYVFKEKNTENIEKGEEFVEKISQKQIRTLSITVKNAVKTLDDLDVLKRLSDKRLIESGNSLSSSIQQDANRLALFFLEQYLDLLSTEALDYRQIWCPRTIEPQMAGNVAFYEIAIQKFDGRTSQSYYNQFVGRAKVCLAELTNDKSLYLSAIPYLERSAEEEGTGISYSWLGKAYARTGRIAEAESIFNRVLADYANKKMNLPEVIALVRCAKGFIELGNDQYKSKFVGYATDLMQKGKLTPEQIKRI